MTYPKGWTTDFVWAKYLEVTNSKPAPESFFHERLSASEDGLEVGMYLEAIDPLDQNQICAAHVTRVVDDLLFVTLDSEEHPHEHIFSLNSMHIFPVGWCEANHYALQPPQDFVDVCKDREEKGCSLEPMVLEPRASTSWCPKIYFNYRCFTGPMISKSKLATLPKTVGPGPVVLVMREVLSMIVSVGYRSARILKVLQCDAKAEPGFNLEVLKAKHKNNTYRANVAIITSGEDVASFCKSICKKLMVCPNLFGPVKVVNEDCPSFCHSTSKSKFGELDYGCEE